MTMDKEQAAGDQDAARILLASHTLAQVYFRKGNLNNAHAHCRKAMIGRRRTLGKHHPCYYNSLKLLVSIYQAKDDPTMATMYADLVPAEFSVVDHSVMVSIPPLKESTEESIDSKL